MKKLVICLMVLAFCAVSTTAEARGFRIPRFKVPKMRTMPKVTPKAKPAKPIPNASRTRPSGARDDSGDIGDSMVGGFVGGMAGSVVGGMAVEAITNDSSEQSLADSKNIQ